MNSVVIFDISAPSNQVIKEGMRARGYYFRWGREDDPNRLYNLPNNIVWKPNTEPAQALSDLNQVIAQVNVGSPNPIRLLRCIILNSTPWHGIEGEPLPS
jgi:hypothetical protein